MYDETRSGWGRLMGLFLAGAVSLALGCATTDDDDDTTAGDDDDTTATGCITVNGEVPGFATLQAAVDHAQDGDAISVCPGAFPGSTVVDKSLSIVGEDPATTILIGDINEVTLSIMGADDVTVSGLTIQSTRNGIESVNAAGLVLDHLVLDDSGQYGVSIEGGDVQLRDSQLSNHPFAAVTAANTTLDISGCTFADIEGYGVRMMESAGSVTGSSFTDVLVPDATDDYDGSCILSEEGTDTLVVDDVEFSGCTRAGVYGIDTDLRVSNSTIIDCANGVVGVGGGPQGVSTVDGNVLQQVPLFGIRLDAQDSSVIGNQLIVTDPGDNTYGIAVSNHDGAFTVMDNEIAGYGRMAIWIQYPSADPEPRGGEAVVSGNTVDSGDLYGILVTNLDNAEVVDNTVRAIRWSGALTDNAYGDGFGIGLWDIGELTMATNLVEDVDVVGIFLQEASFSSTGDSLVGNHLWAVYIGQSAGVFYGLSLDLNDIYGVDARTSEVELNDVQITGMMGAPPPDQWDEPEPYSSTATAVSVDESQLRIYDSLLDLNEDYHVRISASQIQVDNSTFAGPATYGIYSYHGMGTIANSLFDGVGTGIYVNHVDPLLQVGDLSVEGNNFQGNRNGLYAAQLAGGLTVRSNSFVDSLDITGYGTEGYGIYAWDFSADGATVEVRDNTFANLDNSALAASNVALTMTGSNIIDDVSHDRPALLLDTVTGSLTGVAVTNTSGSGIELIRSTVTVTQCTVTLSTGNQLLVTDSAVQIVDNVALSNGLASGIRLDGIVTGAITGNTIADNAGYGISCGSPDVTLTDCDNLMTGNTLGDFLEENGCILGCTAQ